MAPGTVWTGLIDEVRIHSAALRTGSATAWCGHSRDACGWGHGQPVVFAEKTERIDVLLLPSGRKKV
jgi:hypothetical protein